MTITEEVEQFVLAEIAFQESVGRQDDLIESDLLDSAGIVTLLAFLEDRFAFAIDEEHDLVLENFRSIDAISAFVSRKLADLGQPSE